MFVFSIFLGRGFKSHAYTHSVQDGHHVYLNLETQKFYCLPDNYEVIDSSLDDIIVSIVLASRASEHHLDTQSFKNHPSGLPNSWGSDFLKCQF